MSNPTTQFCRMRPATIFFYLLILLTWFRSTLLNKQDTFTSSNQNKLTWINETRSVQILNISLCLHIRILKLSYNFQSVKFRSTVGSLKVQSNLNCIYLNFVFYSSGIKFLVTQLALIQPVWSIYMSIFPPSRLFSLFASVDLLG